MSNVILGRKATVRNELTHSCRLAVVEIDLEHTEEVLMGYDVANL